MTLALTGRGAFVADLSAPWWSAPARSECDWPDQELDRPRHSTSVSRRLLQARAGPQPFGCRSSHFGGTNEHSVPVGQDGRRRRFPHVRPTPPQSSNSRQRRVDGHRAHHAAGLTGPGRPRQHAQRQYPPPWRFALNAPASPRPAPRGGGSSRAPGPTRQASPRRSSGPFDTARSGRGALLPDRASRPTRSSLTAMPSRVPLAAAPAPRSTPPYKFARRRLPPLVIAAAPARPAPRHELAGALQVAAAQGPARLAKPQVHHRQQHCARWPACAGALTVEAAGVEKQITSAIVRAAWRPDLLGETASARSWPRPCCHIVPAAGSAPKPRSRSSARCGPDPANSGRVTTRYSSTVTATRQTRPRPEHSRPVPSSGAARPPGCIDREQTRARRHARSGAPSSATSRRDLSRLLKHHPTPLDDSMGAARPDLP